MRRTDPLPFSFCRFLNKFSEELVRVIIFWVFPRIGLGRDKVSEKFLRGINIARKITFLVAVHRKKQGFQEGGFVLHVPGFPQQISTVFQSVHGSRRFRGR